MKVLGCQRVQGLAQVSFSLADELGVTEMGWAVKFYAEFDELYSNEIISMLKWLENPFDRDCLTPVLVYQSPYDSSKRVADRHAVGSLTQLWVEPMCFCLAKRNVRFCGILSREV